MKARSFRALCFALLCSTLVLPAFAQDSSDAVGTDLSGDPPCACNFDEYCPPTWSARFGAIFLQRSRPQPTLFLYDVNTGDPLINPNNFVFPFQAGADVGLVHYGECWDVDFRYFGINDASSTQGPLVVGPGGALALPGLSGGSPDPMRVVATYETSLNSVEANLRRRFWPNVTLLGGFRYVAFNDRMGGTGTPLPLGQPSGASFATYNDLYGFQIGADTVLWGNGRRFRVESAIKAGVYANATQLSLSLGDPENGNGFVATANRDHTAFVGDLNFTGVYQITDLWSLRAGYQLLWLTGVAVANEQLHTLNINDQPNVNVTHGAFFHGAMVGLERSW